MPDKATWLPGLGVSPVAKTKTPRGSQWVPTFRQIAATGSKPQEQGWCVERMRWTYKCLRPRKFGVFVLAMGLVLTGLAITNSHLRAVELTAPHPPPALLERPVYFDDIIGVRHKWENVTEYVKCVDEEGIGDIQDILCMKRPNFLPKYKNPCWIDWTLTLQRLRCLPYFHILGVDKCGTTDLFSRIAQHPHVLLNGGGLGKETYYWCWLKYGIWMKKTVTPKSFYHYIRVFDKPTFTIADNPDPSGFHKLITGDATPMDFWDFRAWPLIPQNKGLEEPVVLTPHLMKHLYTDPKFIVIFRNPVDRLYSDYIFLGYGFSPEKFRKDVPRAVAMMDSCLTVNTTRQCVFSNNTYINLPMRIHVGMYSVFLKEWLSVFPRSSFYILRTEDYHDNMTHHLNNIYNFLGLDPLPEHIMQGIVEADRKHETKAKKMVNDMYPDTRELLESFYARYNEELAIMLEDPAFLWLPSS